MNRVHETLQAALHAFCNHVTPLIEIPKKLQEYPNVQGENVRLAVHQELIKNTQTIFEGPSPMIKQGSVSTYPNLETILKVALIQEQKENLGMPT